MNTRGDLEGAEIAPILRLGWWLGLAAFIVMIVGFFGIDEGQSNGPNGSIDDLVGDLSEGGRILIGSLVGMVGVVLLVGFIAALRMALAQRGPKGEFLGHATAIFGVVTVVGGFAHASFRMAVSASVDADVLREVIRPLAMLGENIDDMFFWGVLGLVLVMSVSAFMVGFLPKTLGWIGAFLSTVTIVLLPTTLGLGGIALLFWLIAACVSLLNTNAAATP